MHIENILSVFDFGKHKGQSLKHVAMIDPLYIEWCCREVDRFSPSNEIIDELSEYCLSQFFEDPNGYLNEKGSFAKISWQHLRYKGKEMTIGQMGFNFSMKNNVKPSKNHLSVEFSRAIFNSGNCKKLMENRIETKSKEYVDAEDDCDIDNVNYEELRRSNNDAYEINSNEFDGWYEPIN